MDPSPPSTATAQRMLTVRISRGTTGKQFTTYTLPWRANQTVLDLVTEVQRRHDPTLSYRFACRVGVCGSGAVKGDGKPGWGRRTHGSRAGGEGGVADRAPPHPPRPHEPGRRM